MTRSFHERATRLHAPCTSRTIRSLRADSNPRPLVGRTLYLHFGTFVAENLLHMAEEEQVVMPLFERLFSEEEVRGIHQRVMAKLTPQEYGRAVRYVLRATNRPERAAL